MNWTRIQSMIRGMILCAWTDNSASSYTESSMGCQSKYTCNVELWTMYNIKCDNTAKAADTCTNTEALL